MDTILIQPVIWEGFYWLDRHIMANIMREHTCYPIKPFVNLSRQSIDDIINLCKPIKTK